MFRNPNILFLSLMLHLVSCSSENSIEPFVQPVQINPIPTNASIIYHDNNLIHAMDADGGNVTQITFDDSYTLEHVSVSFDRTKIIANYFSDPSVGGQTSALLLYDISKKTRTQLLPNFAMAGNGGVEFDSKGNIYFAGVEVLPFPNASTIPEYTANAEANDIYRVKFDGTNLQNLTNSLSRGEADVSVSPDGQFITYMATNIEDPYNTFTEIWIRNADGANPKLIFIGGEDRVSSVHDPEISPDGNFIVCSQVNNSVLPVFPEEPLANTAHDILKINISVPNEAIAITEPGPISIAPDWANNKVLFLEITDKTNPPHAGLATVNPDGTGYRLIKNGTNIGKWIPE